MSAPQQKGVQSPEMRILGASLLSMLVILLWIKFFAPKPPAIGIKAPYPGFIEPELAAAIDNVPSGKRWLHEIKFDGYRVKVHLGDAAVKVLTRRGHVGETSWIVFLLRLTITNQRTAR